MTAISSFDTLDPFSHGRVDLWYAANLELSIGPEAADPFVQAAVHAILEWLRGEAATPRELVDAFGRPHGLLGHTAPLRRQRAARSLRNACRVPTPVVVGRQDGVLPALARAQAATVWTTKRPSMTPPRSPSAFTGLAIERLPDPGSLLTRLRTLDDV